MGNSSMRVKTPSQSTSIGSLSGGNQQKEYWEDGY